MSEKKKYQPRYSSLENSSGASVNSNASPNATSNTTSDTESINNNQSTKPAGMSFETFIGKNAMAIGASLLIFISMVMFAVVIIPILGDVIKIAAMFLLSFAFIGLGELHAKKKGANKWNTSLVGCGVGGIFVSLFVTYIYFHAIDIIVLYVLLIIWSCFTCFLGKSKSIAFTIIGQLGIVISAAFSATQIYALEDFLAVVAMIILAEASFFATDFFAKSYWNSFSTWLGTALSFVSVFNTYLDEYPFDYIYALAIDLVLVGLAIIIIWYASLIQGRYVDTEGKNNAFQIQLTVTVFPISLLILYFLDGELEYIGLRDIANIIYILLSLAAIYAMDKFQLKTVKDKTLKQVLQVLIAIVSYIAVFNVLSSYFDLGIAIGGGITITMQLLSLIYGKMKKNIFAKAYSLGLILVMVSADFYSEELQLFFVAIMFMAALIERILEKPEERNIVYDSIVYPFGFLLLTDIIYKGCNLFDVMPLYRTVGTYIVLTLLQILAYVVGLARIKKPNGKSYNVMFIIVNVILCIALSVSLFLVHFGVIGGLYVLMLLTLCTINVKDLMENYSWAGAYICGKYTLLCMVILLIYEAEGPIISVVFLLIAIVSIILGFWKNIKAMRLYGLVLSIISVLKLILFDISYDSLILRACSFLFSGLLCFVISFIYNKLDKHE